jgi:hypothetical protein
MTRIALSGGLILRAYESGWIIAEERPKKDGGVREQDLGYYSSLYTALEGLTEHRLRRSNAESLHTLIEAIRGIRQELSDALAPKLELRVQK